MPATIEAAGGYTAGLALYCPEPLPEALRRVALERLASVSDVAEARTAGKRDGLVALVVTRGTKMEKRWARRVRRVCRDLAHSFPAESLVAQMQPGQRPRDFKLVALAALGAALRADHDLLDDWRELAASARAEAIAEGLVGAEALRADALGQPAFDLDSLFASTVTQLRQLDQLWDAQSWVSEQIAGLAGDLGRAIADAASEGLGPVEIAARVRAVISDGTGAQFYLEEAVHQAISAAALSLYASSMMQVDYYAVDDDHTCATCEAYEAGSPYAATACPSPPIHGGCRCWVLPAS